MTDDELRTARLLFDAELTARVLDASDLDTAALRRAARVRRIPARPACVADQLRYKVGRLNFEKGVAGRAVAGRRALLGDRAAARPRFLVRVDEFPHARAWAEPDRVGISSFERFHEIMVRAEVPYLLAVLPWVSREPLSHDSDTRPLQDTEVAMLGRMAGGDGTVSFACHGRDHRTRFTAPRRHSELCGLEEAQTEALVEEALGTLAAHGLRPDVFVPPYNRFDASQLPVLARHFVVVGGGPESIGQMGFQPTPQWRGEAVYLPSYAPFYGRAAEMLPAARRMIDSEAGLWIPVVLHWDWEQRARWSGLERLAALIAPYACSWDEFLEAITRSRAPDGASQASSAQVAEGDL